MDSRKAAATSPENSWRTRNVWAFSLASLFSDWGHELVTALLPGFFTGIGAPVIALGLTEGVSNLAQAWASVWGGRINADSTARHRLLIAGYILTGVKALIALVFWWPWVVLIRTVGWFGRGARGPIRDAYIAEEVPREHVGKAYGIREAFDTAGALLGPLSGALLVAFWNPRTLIALSAIPAIITVGLILRVRKLHSPSVPPAGERMVWSRQWSSRFRQYRVATAVFTVGYLAPTFFILRVWDSSVSVGPISTHTLALLLYTWHNTVYALSAYPVGRWADRMRSGRTLLLVGYGLWTSAVIGFAIVSQNLWSWVALFAVTGLATGIIEIGQKMLTVQAVTPLDRGQAFGQIAGIRGASQLLSGVIMGGMWTLRDPNWGFGVEAVLSACGFMLLGRISEFDAVDREN